MHPGVRVAEALMSRVRRKAFRKAFTLLQLLVSVGIIAVLAGLLLPLAGRVRESARRATDLSHLRQLTAACAIYAGEYEGYLPPGRTTGAPPNADDYTWLNYKTCWKPLANRVLGLDQINSCVSVREGYAESEEFGRPDPDYGSPEDARVGWVYWGGRDDLYDHGAVKYRSMRRIAQHLTPGSQTLWTCWCWDSAGRGGPSVCPHVGTSYVEYAPGVTLKPPPDGLGVGLADGSASFVPWAEMIIIPQANGWKLYYQP